MNPQTVHSVATLILAASISLAAAAAPAREASVDHPRHEMKARASVETCSSEASEESTSSAKTAESSNSSGFDDGIESKSGGPNAAGGNRPPE